MGPLQRWFATATLPVKVFMGISIITAVVAINRSIVAPAVNRKRYEKAEEWANMIFEQEEKEPGSTNIYYE